MLLGCRWDIRKVSHSFISYNCLIYSAGVSDDIYVLYDDNGPQEELLLPRQQQMGIPINNGHTPVPMIKSGTRCSSFQTSLGLKS